MEVDRDYREAISFVIKVIIFFIAVFILAAKLLFPVSLPEAPEPAYEAQPFLDRETLDAIDRLIESLEQLTQELGKYSDISDATGLPAGVLACITAQARENGFDPSETLGRIQHESGFDPDAVSINRKGGKVVSADIGLMQINSKTAPWLWEQVMDTLYCPDTEVAEGITVDGRLFDPYINVRLGSWYYGQLLKQYGDDKEKANTAYNRGGGGLSRWISSRGTARSPYSARVMSLSSRWAGIDEM